MTSHTPAAPVRFGLLGTGPWAQRVHGPALAAHPGTELVGVWGRRPEAAGELAKELSTQAYDDVDALIADVDAIAVALPPDIQAPLAVRAARAGRHLLLDKPVATTVDGARELAEAASEVASVVFFTLRFSAAAAPWIDEQTGRDDWYTGRVDWIGSIYAPDAQSPSADSPWRRERGALWDVGPHALSVLLPVFGDVSEVTGLRGQLDTVHLALRHASGATSTTTLSLTAPEQASAVTAELRGAHGITELPEVWGDGPLASYGTAIDALLEAVRTGEPHPCDVRFGARVTEILAQAEAALR
ncbi:Gfo/Idh/MocA family oxidoreductase [Streptomyces sp. YC504]|uniref:Gfo/Idh/MocA family oxidoreductase n=1 Tax=Streptomyces mesophilus TaxID=1775132 RepID=A0A6G4XTQ6_9ACTN|nr:Gfo/Idh/MocA family oxidoreductase [Streptomyces mesophilus]NGO80828.1 Gfo/Idh/MocA family oxidoreductase [Streptomyces mesophilus]